MASKGLPKRTRGSRRREKLEPEEFIAKMQSAERRKNIALYLASFLSLIFVTIVLLQALGYANLPPKPFYAIVASLLATAAYVIRAIFK